MHWLPLVAMVIASALPFPLSPVPRLVTAATEPGRGTGSHGNGVGDHGLSKDSISKASHSESNASASLRTDSMAETLVDYSSQSNNIYSSPQEDYSQISEVAEKTQPSNTVEDYRLRSLHSHVDYRTPSAVNHPERKTQGVQKQLMHLAKSDTCNNTQNTSTEDTHLAQGLMGVTNLEDYNLQGNNRQVNDVSLDYHTAEDYKSQKRVSSGSNNFADTTRKDNHSPFNTKKGNKLTGNKVTDIALRQNYNPDWDGTEKKQLLLVTRAQGKPSDNPEETMEAGTEAKEVGREREGAGLEAGREREGVGLEAGREREGAGLEVGREIEGAGLEAGREIEGAGLEAGREREGAGLEAGREIEGAGLEVGREIEGAGLEVRRGMALEDAELLFLDSQPRVLFTPASSPPKHPPLLLMMEAGLPPAVGQGKEEEEEEGGDGEVGGALLGTEGAELTPPKPRPKRASHAYDRRGERSVCEVANEWVTDKKTAIDILGNTVTVLPEIQTPRGPLKQYFFETKCRPPDARGTGASGVSGRDCVGVEKKHWVSECKAKQSYVRALTTHPQKGVGWRWIRIDSSCVCVLKARVPRS